MFARVCALVLLALVFTVTARPPLGQTLPASLIADRLDYDRDAGRLTAEGNVEVLYQGRILRAKRIVYDEAAETVRADGPLVLTDPRGGVLLADDAALSPDLQAGLVSGAKLLIAGKLQLAAAEIHRSGGRYTTLQRTIASSCTVCAENPTPTWAIRASRVTQDSVARRIYFENARFELFGLPVGYVPRLSIPEPSVERANGVLVPEFLQSNIYGFGFKLPYYHTLGPSADITVTPFVTTTGAKILEGQYRRRFDGGGFDLSGALALDDGLGDDDGLRGWFSALGAYDLGRGFIAEFDFDVASDDSFLAQFDYSDADRLTSTAGISRTRTEDFVSLDTVAFQSLREDEETDTIPFVFPEFTYRRSTEIPGVGGRLGLNANSLGILRDVGSNMVRIGGSGDWHNDWQLPQGVLASAEAGLDFDLYRVWDNPTLPDAVDTRTMPLVAVEVRWPLVRHTSSADHVIEPIAQVIYSEELGDTDVPNEDSQLPEFDETNLFSLNRFPGQDRLETGLRANLGVSYTREDPSGWSLGATLGQVVRAEPDEDFAEGTGLAGRWSDYVGSVSFDYGDLTLVNRALFDNEFDFRRNEFAMAYDGARTGVRAAYVYLEADDTNPILGPQPETNELSIDARYRLHANWEIRGLWRYDLSNDSNLRAGGGITYGNECAEFDLSVSRRYTSSSNVPPSTSIGFSLRLAGIGESGDREWPPRACMARG